MATYFSIFRDGGQSRPSGSAGETSPAHIGKINTQQVLPDRGSHVIRHDIQALRGAAIILVLLQHAGLPYTSAGFLGVDIFFVISGFLITGLIEDRLESGQFSFLRFYQQRIRRLLPAAFVTLLAVAMLAPVFLDSLELRAFVWQLLGSFFFVANIVLWRQSDYFGSGAGFKPLLHMWSLSIEEQFYLGLPLLLWLCPKRLKLLTIVILSTISCALCLYLVQHSPTKAFYLIPARAWELGFGSIVALSVRRNLLLPRPLKKTRAICALIILTVPFVADERGHPGAVAAVICAASAILMVPGLPANFGMRLLAPLSIVGDRSYSLYLVHWPIIVFCNHILLYTAPSDLSAAILVLCFGVAEVQYRLVEQRFRTMAVTLSKVLLLGGVAIAASAATYVGSRLETTVDTFSRAPNEGFSAQCEYHDTFTAKPVCQSSAAVHIMVWGDSFAISLVNGITAATTGGVVQATQSGCGPFLGLAPTNETQAPRAWSESCISFNHSVADYLSHHPEIQTVVLSSALAQYVPGAEHRGWRALVEEPVGMVVRDQSSEQVLSRLIQTVRAIRAMGKHVVLFAPPPTYTFDTSRCLDRIDSGKLTIPASPDCAFSRSDYEQYRKPILAFLTQVRSLGLLPVVSLDEFICPTARCQTRLNGIMLYRDADHLSVPGSVLLARQMHWGELIRSKPSNPER